MKNQKLYLGATTRSNPLKIHDPEAIPINDVMGIGDFWKTQKHNQDVEETFGHQNHMKS